MKIKLMIAALLLALLAGCTKEPEQRSGTGGDAVLSMTIPGTRGASAPYDDEDIIGARIIVFHSSTPTGAKKMIRNTTDFQRVDEDKMQCREMIPAGYIDVYLIANEAATDIGAALAAINASSTQADVENIRLTYSGLIDPSAAGITMFRAWKGLKIVPNGDSDGTITDAQGTVLTASKLGEVERNAVKLNIKLVCNYASLPWNNSQPVVFKSVTLKSMPKQPYLVADKYYGLTTDDDYFDAGIRNITTGEQTDGSGSVATNTGALTFLVPEHIVSDKSRYTYLEIKSSLGAATLTHKLVLGDGLGTKTNADMLAGKAQLSDYALCRNTEYTIIATIIEQGETDGMQVFMQAQPWGDPINVNGDPLNRMLNVSAVTATVINSSTARIYFWSNQPTVTVDATGRTSTNGTNWSGTYTVSDIFAGLGTGGANISYNPSTGAGYVDFKISALAPSGSYYRSIYINVGGLKREIRIKIYEFSKFFPAYPGVIGYDPVSGDLNLDGRGVMVYFKYGGIIAMYAGTSGNPDPTPYNNVWNGNVSIAFNPSDFTDFSNYLSFPDNSGVSGKGTFTTVGNVNITGSFLNVANAKNGNGDPCRLVGMKAADVKAALASGNLPDNTTWRLPTSAENSVVTMDQTVWVTKASPSDATQRNGHTFAKLDKGSNYTDAAWNFLPASGCRGNSFGAVTNQGEIGYYWSSSPGSATGGYYLLLKNNSITSSYTWSDTQSYGFPVRCVRQ